MILDLNNVFSGDIESVDINCSLDLSDVLESGQKIFETPIQVVGRVENRAGVVICSYIADIYMSVTCDRCLDKVDINKKQEFSSILLNNVNEEENTEHYICQGGFLDFDDMARTDIVLSIPSKVLCSDDCEGLCYQCGAKLSEGDCGCVSHQIDPRLAKLQELFED